LFVISAIVQINFLVETEESTFIVVALQIKRVTIYLIIKINIR
jgi:hypothetical protein